MDELYRVGEKLGHENAGLDMAGGGGDPLAELLAGGGDIEQYLQSYEQMLAEGMPTEMNQLNKVDAEGGITVRPDPGFVVKTRDLQSGMKVFLNITSNEHIEAPHVQSMLDNDNEEGVRVPLSLGTPIEDSDKKQEPCITYDLVANPETVAECSKTPAFRDTVVNLCIASVGQKYKVELDQKYKLPKMKYKGNTVQLQRIRVKNASKIQEVGSAPVPGESKEARASNANLTKPDDDGLKAPDFCTFYAAPDAPSLDGFSANWGPLVEDQATISNCKHISALDLPIYHVNSWKENIRGTMKNQADRLNDEQAAAAAEARTRDMLVGRTCVTQVRMPDLDARVASLKQFRVELSDECLRVIFPPLPKSAKSVYAPLTLWWPFHFYSAQAIADWNPETDTLQVTLPAELPDGVSSPVEFGPQPLDQIK